MILHLDSLKEPFVWHGRAGLVTQYLGKAAGSERLYVNIDRVPPGACSTKYHSHSRQEEFFLVLSGSGTLRLDGCKYDVTEGDFIASQPGAASRTSFTTAAVRCL